MVSGPGQPAGGLLPALHQVQLSPHLRDQGYIQGQRQDSPSPGVWKQSPQSKATGVSTLWWLKSHINPAPLTPHGPLSLALFPRPLFSICKLALNCSSHVVVGDYIAMLSDTGMGRGI